MEFWLYFFQPKTGYNTNRNYDSYEAEATYDNYQPEAAYNNYMVNDFTFASPRNTYREEIEEVEEPEEVPEYTYEAYEYEGSGSK